MNDGSTINNIQIVAETSIFKDQLIKRITTGSCICVEGDLIVSKGTKQSVEVLAKKIEILGDSDVEKYPLQPKKHSLEFLREKAHLRFRTNLFGAVFRIRHATSFAIHKYFNDKVQSEYDKVLSSTKIYNDWVSEITRSLPAMSKKQQNKSRRNFGRFKII